LDKRLSNSMFWRTSIRSQIWRRTPPAGPSR
jgi:hypothetical protein